MVWAVLFIGMSGPASHTAAFNAIVDVTVGCLIGGSLGERWLSSEEARTKLSGGERYQLLSLCGLSSTVQGSKPKSVGDPCPKTLNVLFPDSSVADEPLVALEAPSWTPIPRKVVHLSGENATYKAAVRQILQQKGLQNPTVKLSQVLRVDLDNDGVDEVLVVATYLGDKENSPPPSAKAGTYSLVLLRKVAGHQIKNIMLREEYHVKKGEFNAPSEYSIAAVADLNGDGFMEIVVCGRYYEGEWSEVHSIQGLKTQKVLTCGCGS
jgi:hypothetical protein